MKTTTIITALIAFYLLVSTIMFFLIGGFYFTKKFAIKNLSANQKSINQLDMSIDKARKGVYTGLSDYKKQRSYLFQFEDMFADKSRLLNVFFPVNDGEVFFIESDNKLSGQDALFILRRRSQAVKEKNKMDEFKTAEVFDAYFRGKETPNPQLFTKRLDADIKISDPLFALSLNIRGLIGGVQILQFTKNAHGGYELRKSSSWFDKNKWELKDKSAKKAETDKSRNKNILLAVADIITGGIQLIFAIFYYAYLFVRVVIALFTGGFVK